MAKEKKEKKVSKKTPAKRESKEVSVPSAGRRLAWGGSTIVPKNANDADTNKFLGVMARVYGVPSLGFNVMGDKPYLNKDGRLFLLHEFRKGKQGVKAIRTEFLQMSTKLDEPAICKATIVFYDGHEVEAIGEASKDNVKLEAVKKTLNMMAETRALNRAIWKEVSGDAWDRVSKNLNGVNVSEEEKSKIIDAGKTSYEEMEQPNVNEEPPVASSKEELEAHFRAKVEGCTDADMLIDWDERLQSSKLYSKEFKAEMKKVISAKVDSLG